MTPNEGLSMPFDLPRPINSSKGDKGSSEATTVGPGSLWRWPVLAFQWPAALASSGRGRPEISSSSSAACTSFLACANSTCTAVMPHHIQRVKVIYIDDPVCSMPVNCQTLSAQPLQCLLYHTKHGMQSGVSRCTLLVCQHVMQVNGQHSKQLSGCNVSHKPSQQGQ